MTLVEQHGPANSRASSGGETRIIRSGYGSSAVYARWARESLPEWLELERRTSEQLFVKTGALSASAAPVSGSTTRREPFTTKTFAVSGFSRGTSARAFRS